MSLPHEKKAAEPKVAELFEIVRHAILLPIIISHLLQCDLCRVSTREKTGSFVRKKQPSDKSTITRNQASLPAKIDAREMTNEKRQSPTRLRCLYE